MASAILMEVQPGLVGRSEKPKPGRDGTTLMESVEQRQCVGVAQERIRPVVQQDDGKRIWIFRAFVDLMK
jgi:hypothetical protein